MLTATGLYLVTVRRRWRLVGRIAGVATIAGIVISAGIWGWLANQDRPRPVGELATIRLGMSALEVRLAMGAPSQETGVRVTTQPSAPGGRVFEVEHPENYPEEQLVSLAKQVAENRGTSRKFQTSTREGNTVALGPIVERSEDSARWRIRFLGDSDDLFEVAGGSASYQTWQYGSDRDVLVQLRDAGNGMRVALVCSERLNDKIFGLGAGTPPKRPSNRSWGNQLTPASNQTA